MAFDRFSRAEDERWMRQALQQAQQACSQGEVPIGAIVVVNGEPAGVAHNQVQRQRSAVAHAELLALQQALHHVGDKYLPGATLYTTLEPCAMCAMATRWIQLGRLVFAANDPKQGYARLHSGLLHPKTLVQGGLFAEESTHLLQAFFQDLRARRRMAQAR